MGLDMMLYKRKKSQKEFDYDEAEEVAYWRKANQVHKYFVDECQDGNDDCDYYRVPEEKLKELLKICKLIKDNVKLKTGRIYNGYTYHNGKQKINYITGKIIKKDCVWICERLLPTQEGFFFGSTEYTEYYMEDIDNTIKQIKKVLKETDFKTEELWYNSSW